MSRADFQWDDPLLINQQLSGEECIVRDATRSFAQEYLAPRVLEAFRNEKPDREIFVQMGSLGLLGAPLRNAMAVEESITSATD